MFSYPKKTAAKPIATAGTVVLSSSELKTTGRALCKWRYPGSIQIYCRRRARVSVFNTNRQMNLIPGENWEPENGPTGSLNYTVLPGSPSVSSFKCGLKFLIWFNFVYLKIWVHSEWESVFALWDLSFCLKNKTKREPINTCYLEARPVPAFSSLTRNSWNFRGMQWDWWTS